MTGAETVKTLRDRIAWYRAGCDGLEDRAGYFANGGLAQDAASDLETALDLAEAREWKLRQWLWANHGCSPAVLYGDDGEMQCNATLIHTPLDFRRDDLEELVRACFKLAYRENVVATRTVEVTCPCCTAMFETEILE